MRFNFRKKSKTLKLSWLQKDRLLPNLNKILHFQNKRTRNSINNLKNFKNWLSALKEIMKPIGTKISNSNNS